MQQCNCGSNRRLGASGDIEVSESKNEAGLVGGTEQDRKEILRLHEKYIDVNTRFDWEGLTPLYSPSPEATYFNLNGHTYKGRDHWTPLPTEFRAPEVWAVRAATNSTTETRRRRAPRSAGGAKRRNKGYKGDHGHKARRQ